MLAILAITTPIFLLIGAGYLARWSGIIQREQVQGVGVFVLYCALPALVIRALTQQPLEEILKLNYLVAYGLGSIVVFSGGLLLCLKRQRQPLNASAMQALGMAAANSGFVGYPVAAMVIGSPAAVLLALNMVIENLLIIPAALILAELGSHQGSSVWKTVKHTALSLIKNPVLIGLLVGISLAISHIQIPGPLFKAIDMLADAAGPAALFVIGGTLFGLQVKGMARDVGQIVVGKLLIHPLAIFIAFYFVPGIDPLYMAGALLFAAAPLISIYPLLGQRYGLDGVSAAALLVATIASFFTLSLIIWLMTLSGLITF
ncbi:MULTISPECIES: AEC family transporter [unclassified Halomonas]|uniref:AEC family transporter n=1 Tax=unclassified Halomonas TaxID=2609666 RepID=UPI0007D9031F|nr:MULTISPECIES: AEC family transporter [unclassified Halomonas]MBT2789052.1 AEC family transporter [Halomonas sp. ISL-106]MBT2799670.1 AEC family transporter [Halomonas sp. ISL-104]OAL60177.1 permease [Halomonas sp. ALS9]